MLRFFNWPKKSDITSTIVFDERFCHSTGAASGAGTYETDKGTTEIIFIFGRFGEFIDTYLFDNPYLPDGVKRLVAEKRGVFCAQLVQDGLYMCRNGVSPDGRLSSRPESLTLLKGGRRLRVFSGGAIAFGIFQPDTLQFHVLWATMYKTGTRAAAA